MRCSARRACVVFNTGGIYTLISPTSAGLAIQAVKKANEYVRSSAADLNYAFDGGAR